MQQNSFQEMFLEPQIHIKMISEGSCDTEDWSNNAKNAALPSQEYITFSNILRLKIVHLKCNNISRYLLHLL